MSVFSICGDMRMTDLFEFNTTGTNVNITELEAAICEMNTTQLMMELYTSSPIIQQISEMVCNVTMI